MQTRTFGRLGWPVSEIGYGLWGVGGWTGSDDAWADDDRWMRALERLKSDGLVRAVGISLNRWEPANGIKALRTGVIDSVQVVYNIFDQNPEDELFPVCRELGIAVIARVPF